MGNFKTSLNLYFYLVKTVISYNENYGKFIILKNLCGCHGRNIGLNPYNMDGSEAYVWGTS